MIQMKNAILFLVITVYSISFCNAQQIDIEKVFGGYKYTHNNELISIGDLASIIESNTKAFEIIKKGRSSRNISGILGFAGGGLIGWPLSSSLAGGKANWTLAGIGAGLIVTSIPISSKANKNINKAVNLYNTSFIKTSNNFSEPELNILANTNGLGLSMTF